MKSLTIIVVALSLALGRGGRADAAIAATFDEPYMPTTSAIGASHGWQFTANAELVVTHLGFFDYGEDGLAEAHDVGMYNSSGDLLRSATLSAGTGDPLVDLFRYVPVTPINLSLGESYVIATNYPTRDDEIEIYPVPTGLAFDANITYVCARWGGAAGGTLIFPANAEDFYYRFGPNFQSEVIPEPSTVAIWSLLTTLGITVGWWRQRRRAD